MGLTVEKLNGDTTFLLTFDFDTTSKFTILLDPWLRGQSTWVHPSFQFSEHTVSPVIDSLAKLGEDIDLIIISQDKPDHCHRETLCSWPANRPIKILATAAAARKIRDWQHFPLDSIHELRPYNEHEPGTLYTEELHGVNLLSIANISSRKDLTGLHNAIGITVAGGASFSGLKPRRDSRMNDTAIIPPMDEQHKRAADETASKSIGKALRTRIKSYRSLRLLGQQQQRTPPSTPPRSPSRCEVLSCVYTPHGVSPALCQPYIDNHLRPSGALPLTALVHSTVLERNPWYMGGVVAAGTPGGIEIIKALNGQVRSWISAHDEPKDNRGVSVKLLKTERYNPDQVLEMLDELGYGSVAVQCPSPGHKLVLAG